MEEETSSRAAANVAAKYVRMAKGLRRLGELSLALAVCERGIKRLPGNSAIYIVTGQIQIASYHAKGKSVILKSALINFRKALKLDPENYIAKLLASKIYLKAGAREKARGCLEQILGATPDDERAKKLLAVIEEKEKKVSAAERETSVSEEPDERDDNGDNKALADHGQSADRWRIDEKISIESEDTPEDERVMETLESRLTLFGRLEGLNGIFLLDKNGLPHRIINRANLDENLIPSFVYNLVKVSMTASVRCGFGDFQKSVLISPIGIIITASIAHATLALVVSEGANLSAVEKRLQRYIGETVG